MPNSIDEHWYYLHTNGDLMHKRLYPGDDNSPFVRRIWRINPSDRATAWIMLLEACALNANRARVKELCQKWGCDAKDFTEFMLQTLKPTQEMVKGAYIFFEKILGLDFDAWAAWLERTPKGAEPDWSTMPKPKEEAPNANPS